MRELRPGLYHWETFHDSISTRVSSYYVEPAGVVIDPKVPEGGFDELPGKPQQVVLTSGHHHRDAQQFAERFGIPVRGSREAAARLEGELEIEPFGDGDELAPGVTAIHIGKLSDDEGALHIALGEGALAFADGLHRQGGALGFFPDELLGDDPQAVKDGLKQSFHGLLERDFDTLLFAHGEPLVGGGKAALRKFVTSPVGHAEFGQSM
jgi:hypothetical protein